MNTNYKKDKEIRTMAYKMYQQFRRESTEPNAL